MLNYLQWRDGVDRIAMTQRQGISTPAATYEEVEKYQQPEPQHEIPVVTDDIAILTKQYGTLSPGMTIKIELNTACELLGRSRKRVDAFKTLAKRLADEFGVQLIIYSRKKRP